MAKDTKIIWGEPPEFKRKGMTKKEWDAQHLQQMIPSVDLSVHRETLERHRQTIANTFGVPRRLLGKGR